MKKKLLALLLASTMVLSTTACGSTESGDNSKEPQNSTENVSVPEESKKETSKKEDAYFKDDTLKIDMATIKITGFEVAPPNTEFGEEKSTLIITYDFTNDSDELMQPGVAWISCFEATQETETTVDTLDVAMMPQDEKYTAMNDISYTDVKPGATVQSVISYEINDITQPVTLTAVQGALGNKLGEKVFNLQ